MFKFISSPITLNIFAGHEGHVNIRKIEREEDLPLQK